jgi:2-amino-4-hydroxy-6-hydroxymethyldihydropteridine diphosphokinase
MILSGAAVLPHPRAHTRGFVLLPLRDVAPDWVHPGLGLGVEPLLARL